MARVLVAGCGDLGSALAARLVADGYGVFGLRRRPAQLPPGVAAVAADLTDRDGLVAALEPVARGGIDAVVYAAAADGGTEEAYRRAYVVGLAHVLEWAARRGARAPAVLFTSSTGVYAQQDGAWVDEESPAEPTHWSGRKMLEAERLLGASGLRGVALRLGGLYGPGRTRLVESVLAQRATIRPGPPRYTNRIHRDDAAGALRHLTARLLAGEPVAPLYLGVDDEPADEAEVLRWLAARIGAPPPRVAAAADETGAGGRARAASNKRCSNARLRATGYRFRFPSYREGYADVLAASGVTPR
jgi:nucleoside-diphosphate-sugar epimerase